MTENVQLEITDDDDLINEIGDIIGTLEDLIEVVKGQDYQQVVMELNDITSTIGVFRTYLDKKAEE